MTSDHTDQTPSKLILINFWIDNIYNMIRYHRLSSRSIILWSSLAPSVGEFMRFTTKSPRSPPGPCATPLAGLWCGILEQLPSKSRTLWWRHCATSTSRTSPMIFFPKNPKAGWIRISHMSHSENGWPFRSAGAFFVRDVHETLWSDNQANTYAHSQAKPMREFNLWCPVSHIIWHRTRSLALFLSFVLFFCFLSLSLSVSLFLSLTLSFLWQISNFFRTMSYVNLAITICCSRFPGQAIEPFPQL